MPKMTFPQNSSPSQQSQEISLSQDQLQKIGLLILCLAVTLSIIGGFVSPHDNEGNPILLLPEVKAVEDYRRSAQGWTEHLWILDGEIASLMETDSQGDLFTQSRQAQQMLEHAVTLAKEVDQTQTPAAAIGFHEQMYSAAMAYLEAARSGMRWVSAPETDRRADAETKLEQARSARKVLEANQWISRGH
jgi:hypothetical protein